MKMGGGVAPCHPFDISHNIWLEFERYGVDGNTEHVEFSLYGKFASPSLGINVNRNTATGTINGEVDKITAKQYHAVFEQSPIEMI